ESRRGQGAIVLLLAIAGFLVFGRLLGADFVRWDDFDMIVGNGVLRPIDWGRIWGHAIFGLYTPLSYTLLAILTAVSWTTSHQLNPAWFHACNLTLHVLTALAVYALLRHFIHDRTSCGAGAALFLLHPLAVEPVAWCASLNTLLGTLLVMSALILATRAARLHGRHRIAVFGGSAVLYTLALLAKPSVCAAPLALLGIDYFVLRLPWRRAFMRCVAWGAVSVPFMVMARIAQPATAIVAPSIAHRLLVAADAFGFYLAHWALPWPLGIDYGRTPATLAMDLPTSLHIGLAIAVVLLALLQWRRRPYLAGAVLIALGGVAPVLGLVPFDFQYYSTVADRYAYFATLGPAMLLALLFFWGRARQSVVYGIRLVLILCAIGSAVQSGTWMNSNTLMQHALAVNPQSVAAFETLGYMSAQVAEDPRAPVFERQAAADRAFSLYQSALRMRPNSGRTHFTLGNLLSKAQRPADAIAQYAAAEASLGDDARLQNNWGIACFQLHDVTGAIAHFDRAIAAHPDEAVAYANKATVLLRSGQRDDAVQLAKQALALDPAQPQALHVLSEVQTSSP
ncbi:MAG: tetratricopeptide repeat protein, partial [Tepidisphaeraceae bacterium]